MSEIIDTKSLATLHSSLTWQSAFAKHVETFYVPLNVWRELEFLPDSLARSLLGQRAGAVITVSFAPGSLVPAHNASQIELFPQYSFAHGRKPPRLGRFYPRGLLLGYAQNPLPFRCASLNGDGFFADLNHPLAKQPLELKVTVADVHNKTPDTGGECRDWLQIICDGPG
jgi:FKBP-type peptidyl-prolyl cis-trans isomerase 2